MPLTVIATNPSTILGVANGTACTFIKFFPEPDLREIGVKSSEAISSSEFKVFETDDGKLPDVMFVHVPGLKRQIGDLPKEIFPIFPIVKTIKVVTHISKNTEIQVRQFPVIPRFSLTGHKTQGQTLSSIVIHLPEKDIQRSKIPGSWLYVQFFRVN